MKEEEWNAPADPADANSASNVLTCT